MILETLDVELRFADDVGDDEDDIFRVLLDQSRTIRDAGIFPDCVFNLSQLDPQPPDLYLVILPPQILDISIGQPAGDVSGPIDSFTRIGGIVGELFPCQGRVVKVTSRQADPGDAQLSGLPDRNLPTVPNDIESNVVDRSPDRNAFEIVMRQGNRNS